MPSSPSRRAELDRLGARPFAHRGLHGRDAPENGLAAFAAAVARGDGIELDVRASRDGEAIVFHDERLDRLTAECGTVGERDAAALKRIALRGGGTIPTLADALHGIGGRAGLLIEVKAPGRRVAWLCAAVAAALEGYAGPVGVMSFNPEVGRWFAARRPSLLRGLVVAEGGRNGLRGRVERRLSLLRARADFLACDVRDLPSAFASGARSQGLAVYTWTVRTAADRARAEAHADQIIYEEPA
ncbi:MAG: glycerophosphodiester phosphodiesterase [Alphaproteobacteria bacterium]|nr:glycerophosphodiester phosphodiesterase [Alphaproteobacteria bacterium]MBV9371797.1 glycerophosphodiester phosphodiesterase [Alphaproteobacteria bacterium]MBV9901918.1 glycerophosphodiester phosphodiesterase [Alphaproteobacteria bacterium]